jgi:hypothetical protein
LGDFAPPRFSLLSSVILFCGPVKRGFQEHQFRPLIISASLEINACSVILDGSEGERTTALKNLEGCKKRKFLSPEKLAAKFLGAYNLRSRLAMKGSSVGWDRNKTWICRPKTES